MSLLKELGLFISDSAINIPRLTALRSDQTGFALRAQCGRMPALQYLSRQFLLKCFLQP